MFPWFLTAGATPGGRPARVDLAKSRYFLNFICSRNTRHEKVNVIFVSNFVVQRKIANKKLEAVNLVAYKTADNDATLCHGTLCEIIS